MSLPILKSSTAPTTDTLIRYFHQTASSWTAHVAELELLDVGSAWSNSQLNRVPLANRMLDVALPAEINPQQAMQMVEDHFAGRGSMCLEWVMNPAAPAEQTAPMAEFLAAQGYRRDATDIMYLDHLSGIDTSTTHALTIIPARASFKHAQSLYEQSAGDGQFADAEMLHLDDPHYDALIALKDGAAVAHVGVLSAGEIGLLKKVFVAPNVRGGGIGTIMMNRAMEICARSLFKHVLLGALPGCPANRLYERFGFRKIGSLTAYARP